MFPNQEIDFVPGITFIFLKNDTNQRRMKSTLHVIVANMEDKPSTTGQAVGGVQKTGLELEVK